MSRYTCNNCGYETEHNGAFNLHKYHCDLKARANGGEVQKSKKKQTPSCEHEWRLLSPSHPLEQRAIENGYKEVCEKCQSVQ